MGILRVEDVSQTYQAQNGEVAAFRHISLDVREGEFVSIVGPSGCGKSTLLSVIAGLLPPTQGRVTVRGKPVRGVSGHVGYMLQRDSLLEWRTIWSNVLFGLEIRRAKTQRAVERADELMRTYGLDEFRDKYPRQLSGGMRQRAALIRTLAAQPEILLLDEPFSALDYQTRLNVCDDVYNLMRSEKKTAMLVTHDLSEAISVADRILVLSARPAHVVAVHELNFGDTVPLKRREMPEFSRWFETLWKELNV